MPVAQAGQLSNGLFLGNNMTPQSLLAANNPTPQQTPGASLGQTLLSQAQPELAAGQAGIDQAQLATQLDPQAYALAQQNAQANYANQMAQYGLSATGLGEESQYNQATLANQMAQYGLQGQGLGLEQGYLGQQQGFAGQSYGLEQAGLGLQQGGLAAQLANLQAQYPLAVQGQEGSAAASGATSTVGNRNALGQLGQQQQFNLGNLQTEQAQLGLQGQQNALGYQQQLASLGYQQGQLGLNQQSLGLQEQSTQQGAAYQAQQLGLQQQGLGLEQQLAGTNFGYQNTLTGIQGAMSQAQDYTNLANQVAGQANTVNQALNPLSALQGMNFSEPTMAGN